MRMRPQGIAALATTVTSAIFNVTTVVGSDWIHLYLRPYVWPLWATSALLWIWFWVARVKESTGADPHPLASGNGSNTNRNVVSPNISPNIQVSPTFNIGAAEAQPHERTEVPRANDSVSKQLRLRQDGVDIARLKYEPDEGRWVRGDDSNREGLLIWIANDHAPIGQPNYTAKKLKALIQFRSETAYRAAVSRAYWLETYCNQIDLDVGDRRAVVVGIDAHNAFQAYENRVTARRTTHWGGFDSYAELPNPSVIPKDEYIRFAITLIEGSDQHSVFKGTFQIYFQPGNWHARQIEDVEL
jgi:hypothetical protein